MTDKPYPSDYINHDDSDLLLFDGSFAYEYDNNGNLIAKSNEVYDGSYTIKALSDIKDPAKVEYYQYGYDLKNRLISVHKYIDGNMENTANYLYDVDGYRIQKENKDEVVTHYIFDTSGKVLEEIDIDSGNVVSSVFLKNRHLARVTEDETLFYGTDHQGSTVLVTDETGTMVWTGEATPFGDGIVREEGDRTDISLKYTGKDLDEDTGLYYYNARWYDADTGRFISQDPARDGANWYVYVSNNPLKYTDPTGMMSDSASFAAAQAGLDIENSDNQYGHTYIRDEYDYKDFSKMLDHIEKSNAIKIQNNEKEIENLKDQFFATEIDKRTQAAENLRDIVELGITFDNGSMQDIAEFASDSQFESLDYNLDLSQENKDNFSRFKEFFNLRKDNKRLEDGRDGAKDLQDDIEKNNSDEDNEKDKNEDE